jgi:3-deoxy-D-manno-octulosonic acid (KDO) 8-phosphate synthase
MIETIAKAGIAVGVDGIFIETHFDPANAKVMVQICCIWIILRP